MTLEKWKWKKCFFVLGLLSSNGGACNFIKTESLAQVFSCEFCEVSKNTFFYRTPLVAAFVRKLQLVSLKFLMLVKMKSTKKNEAHSLNSIRTLLLIYLLFSKPLVK